MKSAWTPREIKGTIKPNRVPELFDHLYISPQGLRRKKKYNEFIGNACQRWLDMFFRPKEYKNKKKLPNDLKQLCRLA